MFEISVEKSANVIMDLKNVNRFDDGAMIIYFYISFL